MKVPPRYKFIAAAVAVLTTFAMVAVTAIFIILILTT